MPVQPDLIVRPFLITDYKDLRAIWEFIGIQVTAVDQQAAIDRLLRCSPGTSLIAEWTGDIVGGLIASEDTRAAHIYSIAVHPAYRKKGVGRKLVEEALKNFTRLGLTGNNIYVHINHHDENLVCFFENVGWVHRHELIVMSTELGQLFVKKRL